MLEPVQNLVPGHFHYARTEKHKMVPIRISHVGAEQYFRTLADDQTCKPEAKRILEKVLLHDACRYLTHPTDMYADIANCLKPDGILLIVHRPAELNTLPIFKNAQQR